MKSRGSALIEALVALAFFIVAASVLAGAATVGLRASRRAALLDGLTLVAARELAMAEARGTEPRTEEAIIAAPGLGPSTRRRIEVTRDDEGVASYTVRITAPDASHVELQTRLFTDG